jgi:hypothetical protein
MNNHETKHAAEIRDEIMARNFAPNSESSRRKARPRARCPSSRGATTEIRVMANAKDEPRP